MIHWNKLLNHIGKEFPHFNFLECCSLFTPKLWTSKGNSDYNRTRAEVLTRPFGVQLSQKSVPHKFPVIKLQASRTAQIHSMCSAGSLHIQTGCLPGALQTHANTTNLSANTFLMDRCISISIMEVLKLHKRHSSSLKTSCFEVEQ